MTLCRAVIHNERAGPFMDTTTRERGGHPLPDLFRPTIYVPLRATQAESKRGTTKQ